MMESGINGVLSHDLNLAGELCIKHRTRLTDGRFDIGGQIRARRDQQQPMEQCQERNDATAWKSRQQDQPEYYWVCATA